MTTAAPRPGGIALPALVAFAVGLALRLGLLAASPWNFSFDGFQRWAGRAHLLVQSWLPATQAVIASVAALGGDLSDVRLALALVASGASAAAAVVAGQLGGRRAAWAAVVPAVYGPSLLWGTALYQEGTFLLLLFGGLALALAGRTFAADIVFGALALVRYEGWPCVLLYLAWRRDPRAFVVLWGAGLWLVLRGGLGVEGHAASPMDFDDWKGLAGRVTPASWLGDAGRLFGLGWGTGAVAFAVAGACGAWAAWARRGVPLLAAVGVSQVAAVGGWLAGLEVATSRMLVLPAQIAGVLGAVGVAVLWDRLPRWGRPAVVAGGAALCVLGVVHAWAGLGVEERAFAPERAVRDAMALRPACGWVIVPRTRLGTRARHDGCEVVQGLGAPRHGDGFWCAAWGPTPPSNRACVVTATWGEGIYVLSETVGGAGEEK